MSLLTELAQGLDAPVRALGLSGLGRSLKREDWALILGGLATIGTIALASAKNSDDKAAKSIAQKTEPLLRTLQATAQVVAPEQAAQVQAVQQAAAGGAAPQPAQAAAGSSLSPAQAGAFAGAGSGALLVGLGLLAALLLGRK